MEYPAMSPGHRLSEDQFHDIVSMRRADKTLYQPAVLEICMRVTVVNQNHCNSNYKICDSCDAMRFCQWGRGSQE